MNIDIKKFENLGTQERPEECVMYDGSDYFPNLTEYIADKMRKDCYKNNILEVHSEPKSNY